MKLFSIKKKPVDKAGEKSVKSIDKEVDVKNEKPRTPWKKDIPD